MAPPLTGPQFSAETISGITGSISIACWLVVFSPQIVENFRRRSGDGLSLSFLVIWLAGDVFNVLGAILQHVLPTMIILALYCIAWHSLLLTLDTLADIILIAQVLYYRRYPYRKRRRSSHSPGPSHLSPATPLLNPDKPPKRPPPVSTLKAGPFPAQFKAEFSPNKLISRNSSRSFRDPRLLSLKSLPSHTTTGRLSRRLTNRDLPPRTNFWMGLRSPLPRLPRPSSRQKLSQEIHRGIKSFILPICVSGQYHLCTEYHLTQY